MPEHPPLVRPEPRRDGFEQQFWTYVQARDLRLQRCAACGTFRYPPAAVCSSCLAESHVWSPISGHGRVVSWAVFRKAYFPELPIPYVVVAAELAEGPILIANLVNASTFALEVDLPLRITYETARSASGAEWLIYQWEPAVAAQ